MPLTQPTRHGTIPVDTNAKGTMDLANVQINAANLGERSRFSAAPQPANEAPQGANSRNPYSDNTIGPSPGHGPTKQVGFQTIQPNHPNTTPMSRQNNNQLTNGQYRHSSQRDLSMPADSRLDAFQPVAINQS